jgi:hypothetical protein
VTPPKPSLKPLLQQYSETETADRARVTPNMATEPARAFWASCARAAEEVRKWPACKRAGINVRVR